MRLSLEDFLCLGMLILGCSHCLGCRTSLYLVKGSIIHGIHIWVVAKISVLKINSCHLAVLLHDFIIVMPLFMTLFQCMWLQFREDMIYKFLFSFLMIPVPNLVIFLFEGNQIMQPVPPQWWLKLVWLTWQAWQ